MSHEIDEIAPGVHAAVFAREDAWHRLGNLKSQYFTAQEAMDEGHLGRWDVRKIRLTATEVTETGVTSLEVPDRWATVRTNPVTGAVEYLGTVGGHYTPIQNESHVDLLNAVVDESGAHFDTAGSLSKGRQVFVGMKLPNHLEVAGADRIDLNLIALNSHDGSTGFRFLVSPIRVVCKNTAVAAIAGARASFSVRHTGQAGVRLQEAREALGLTFKYIEGFGVAAERLAAKAITPRWFETYAAELLGVDLKAKDKSSKKTLAGLDALQGLWRTSDTLDGVRKTRWGAYNALTEYVDHFAPANGEDKALARATRTVTSHATNVLKERAFSLALVGA